jgi:O-succinylbenzoic acid--CoA ligase
MTAPPGGPDWVAAAAADTPSAPALVVGDGLVVDYATLDQRIEAEIATAEPPLEPGSRQAVVAVADLDGITRLWARWRTGAVPIVSPARPDPDLRAALSTWELVDRGSFEGGDHTWVPTSGSTGVPKAVRLTSANVAAAVSASQARLGNGAGDRWLLALPLHHVGGLSVLWRSAAVGGAVVLQSPFDAVATADLLASGAVTYASLVPTMLARVLDAGPSLYRGVRAVLVGGAAAPPRLMRRALDAGLPVLATYGSTETCSQIATVAPGEQEAATGTAGRPLDGLSVTVDADDGGVGEIVVEGEAVSVGYGLEPVRTGPLRTGDLGRFDGNGRLVVEGRADDVIRTGGEKVVPQRVEAALVDGVTVTAAAVVGVADAAWGETVTALIVVGDGYDEEAVTRRARQSLAPHEVPKRLVVVDALPLLPNGKLDRIAATALAVGAHATRTLSE